METAVSTLIIITLLLVAILSLSHAYLSAQDEISESWQKAVKQADARSRTDLTPVGAQITGTSDLIEVTIRNDGSTKLADFDRWDVIAEYGTGLAYLGKWYPYVEADEPGYNQWTVSGIYLDAANGTEEAYEPGILNPGEEMIIRLRVSPPVGEGTTNLVTVGTLDGIYASTVVTR